ncbi:hypothetical protein F383_37301 [Gossypium arboreum]|uniref:Uncharacterized protein n=1 Tax=Gossypium arboreum TaxID=29729 RepID=A0A0B0M7N4_GOSAR|nr:hypothetical protein F383_37301 [Gossypium arboreum]
MSLERRKKAVTIGMLAARILEPSFSVCGA